MSNKLRSKKNVVHVIPYEAFSSGRINHTLKGLHSSGFYRDTVARSILIGPSRAEGYATQQEGLDFKVLYCARYGLVNHAYAREFAEIEHKFGISITYGVKSFGQSTTTGSQLKIRKNEYDCEILLIDVSFANPHPVNALKGWLFEEFSLQSDRYESNDDFENCIKLAPSALAALRSMGVANPQQPGIIIGHDYAGLPAALAAVMDPLGSFKTAFFAHEVPAVRNIITNHPGHDSMFHNAHKLARQKNLFLSEIFNLPHDDYRHALVSIGCHCDCTMAANDYIANELRGLNSMFAQARVEPVYKGTEPPLLSFEAKIAVQEKLRDYCRALFGYRPDYIFTHSADLDVSGGYWRDLRILDKLDRELNKKYKRAIFYLYDTNANNMFSTDYGIPDKNASNNTGGNNKDSTNRNESNISGRISGKVSDNPTRKVMLDCINDFNRYHHNIKAVLISPPTSTIHSEERLAGNESHTYCGATNINYPVSKLDNTNNQCNIQVGGNFWSREIDFSRLHIYSDVDFNLSIYEPFGQRTMEALATGAVIVINQTAGCVNQLEKALSQLSEKNSNNEKITTKAYSSINNCVIRVDYTGLSNSAKGEVNHYFNTSSLSETLGIGQSHRDEIEEQVSKEAIQAIIQSLPQDDNQREIIFRNNQRITAIFSWDNICNEFFVPALEQVYKQYRSRLIA